MNSAVLHPVNIVVNSVVQVSSNSTVQGSDEPTGVNNAVLTVHIKHDSNPVLCCVNRFEKGCWNSTYHQYCFIMLKIFFFPFTVYVIISCIIPRHKNTQYILQKIYYWRQMIYHNYKQPSGRYKQARSLNKLFWTTGLHWHDETTYLWRFSFLIRDQFLAGQLSPSCTRPNSQLKSLVSQGPERETDKHACQFRIKIKDTKTAFMTLPAVLVFETKQLASSMSYSERKDNNW